MVPGSGFAIGPTYTKPMGDGKLILRVDARAAINESYGGRLDLSVPRLFSDATFLTFSTQHRNISEMPYYGAGPDSRKTGRSNYRLEDTNVELRPGVRVFKGLSAGLIGSYLAVNTGPGHSTRYISTEQQFGPARRSRHRPADELLARRRLRRIRLARPDRLPDQRRQVFGAVRPLPGQESRRIQLLTAGSGRLAVYPPIQSDAGFRPARIVLADHGRQRTTRSVLSSADTGRCEYATRLSLQPLLRRQLGHGERRVPLVLFAHSRYGRICRRRKGLPALGAVELPQSRKRRRFQRALQGQGRKTGIQFRYRLQPRGISNMVSRKHHRTNHAQRCFGLPQLRSPERWVNRRPRRIMAGNSMPTTRLWREPAPRACKRRRNPKRRPHLRLPGKLICDSSPRRQGRKACAAACARCEYAGRSSRQRLVHKSACIPTECRLRNSNADPATARRLIPTAPGASLRPRATASRRDLSSKTGDKNRYVLKFDPPQYPELCSAADVIGSKIFYALGYNTPENYIVHFRREQLEITDGVMYRHPSGKKIPLTAQVVDELLQSAAEVGRWHVPCAGQPMARWPGGRTVRLPRHQE